MTITRRNAQGAIDPDLTPLTVAQADYVRAVLRRNLERLLPTLTITRHVAGVRDPDGGPPQFGIDLRPLAELLTGLQKRYWATAIGVQAADVYYALSNLVRQRSVTADRIRVRMRPIDPALHPELSDPDFEPPGLDPEFARDLGWLLDPDADTDDFAPAIETGPYPYHLVPGLDAELCVPDGAGYRVLTDPADFAHLEEELGGRSDVWARALDNVTAPPVRTTRRLGGRRRHADLLILTFPDRLAATRLWDVGRLAARHCPEAADGAVIAAPTEDTLVVLPLDPNPKLTGTRLMQAHVHRAFRDAAVPLADRLWWYRGDRRETASRVELRSLNPLEPRSRLESLTGRAPNGESVLAPPPEFLRRIGGRGPGAAAA